MAQVIGSPDSVTNRLRNTSDPVTAYMGETFWHTRQLLIELNRQLRAADILLPESPVDGGYWGMAGEAIDMRLRMHWRAFSSSWEGRCHCDGDCLRCLIHSTTDKDALDRLCAAAALQRQCRRAERAGLNPPYGVLYCDDPASNLADVPDFLAADIAGMRKRFEEVTPAAILDAPAICNPVVGKPGHAGDGDLVVNGTLYDFKCTKQAAQRNHLYQLLQYAALDWPEQFGIRAVGFYFTRQGVWVSWPVEELMERLHGGPLPMDDFRMALCRAVISDPYGVFNPALYCSDCEQPKSPYKDYPAGNGCEVCRKE